MSAGPFRSSRRLATIDLGSNTVRYLLVDVEPGSGAGWRTVDADQRVTRLGEGLAASGRLGPTPMARTADAVVGYARRARALGARQTHIVATSAVREAANGREFAADLERTTGAAVRIVTGEDEARLTVRGVRAGLRALAAPFVVFDIGGGSTEFVLWREAAVGAAVSLRLGVVPLAERYPFPGPVDWPRYRQMADEIEERLAHELPAALLDAGPLTLVGTAGTVTTLAALDLGLARYDAARVQGHRLARGAVERQLERLGALTVEGRAGLPCLEPGRADLIVPGVAIAVATMGRLGVSSLTVSDWSLREGIVAELLDGPC